MSERYILDIEAGIVHYAMKRDPRCNLHRLHNAVYVDEIWPVMKRDLKIRKSMSDLFKKFIVKVSSEGMERALVRELRTLHEKTQEGFDACPWCMPELSRDPKAKR